MDAGAWILGLHLLSQHWPNCHHEHDTCVPYNNVNPGVYVRAPSGLTLGAYRNSYARGSAYAGWTWESPDGRFAFTAALATGYPRARLIPIAAPSVRFELGQGWALRVAGAPRVQRSGAAVVHASLERPL